MSPVLIDIGAFVKPIILSISIQRIRVMSMTSMDEQILKATKEIVVKFIEAGRVSPAGFHETFRSVHLTVKETALGLLSEDD
jgi:hypothetical protein